MLKGKTVVLGVTGGIAAYKAADLASRLAKEGAEVYAVLTQNATEFITPLTFETLTGHRAITDTFDRNFEWKVSHISLAKKADVLLIAPCTANVMAKLAHGLADDMLTTTTLAMRCPKLIAPAMNTAMYENPVTQRNLEILRQDGFAIIEPAEGILACKDSGKGKLAPVDTLYDAVMQAVAFDKDLTGVRILVTAGPTQEPIDPVRYITNHSSGKMGYAVAQAAARRGAEVTLISGPCSLPVPYGVNFCPISSADEMFEQVKSHFERQDIVIKAAAVGDYRPAEAADEKIKKSGDAMTLALVKNPDILRYIGAHKHPGQILCGFSMETQNLVENSTKKLREKNCDMIVANNLRQKGAGFSVDTNIATVITAEGVQEYGVMTKDALAHAILDRLRVMRES